MDFKEAKIAPVGDGSLEDVQHAIKTLEKDHLSKGIKLSGRILHVCHYLPIVSTLATGASSVLSPPKTPDSPKASIPFPDSTAAAVAEPSTQKEEVSSQWTLTARGGHSAMNSGIRSLSETHEQVIVAWTGDIEVGSQRETIPTGSLTQEDKEALEKSISEYKNEAEDKGEHKITYVPVWLDDKVAHDHYEGYCKSTLWPLFHYLLWQDVATEAPAEDQFWNGYLKANEAYAQKLFEVYRPGDLVWIHDYHCLLVPKAFRQLAPEAFIGLFVHTPFPSSEVFRCLPRRKEVLDGMLGANLVCFQTYSYSRHFASSCIRVCGYESAPGGIDVQGQVVAIMHCPVGVDAVRIGKDTLLPDIQPKLEALRALYEGKKIIVARDKLDVVKGVVQKLRAFEKLLEDYPEWRGNAVLIQVTSPALSDSPKLERQVSELVAHINGVYGSLDFIPVHHYHQTIKKEEFYALLSVADLALITPLRDGMNTTSMEFVICQEKTNKSPIVLSEFMGISHNMTHALQINPWNLGDVAAAINRGLTMSEGEKESRQAALYKIVTTHTSHTWAALLVHMLLTQIGNVNTAHQTPVLDRPLLKQRYSQAKRRLLLFDYDGTLTPIVRTPSQAIPSENTLLLLQKLSDDPKNLVYIISGRDGGFLDTHMGQFKKIGLSAEHGCFLREPGKEGWTSLTDSLDMSWMSEVEEVFKYYTERTTGSFIELKRSSITWHYRGADPEWGSFQCNQCLDLLENNLAPKRPIEVLVGKKNLEVRPIAINKGEIVKRIVYDNPDAEFIFCAGDDKTDEDMFRSLRTVFNSGTPNGTMPPPVSTSLLSAHEGKSSPEPKILAISPESVFSVTVGSSSKKTLAKWHVTSSNEIVDSVLVILDEPSSHL